jgi:AraC-like DNA-binding protein
MNVDEYVEMRVLPWAKPVDVLRARYTTFEFPTHAHAEYTIGEVLQGSELFAHRRKEVKAPNGWFIHLDPGEAHNGRAAQDSWTYVSLYPGVEFMRMALPELCSGGDPHFDTPVSHRPELRGRIASFVRRVFDAADDLNLQSALLEILHDLIRPPSIGHACPWGSGRSAAIARVRERLSDTWDQNLSLTELAESASMTPLTLLRSFRREVGCTPQVYRTARRLEVARKLMREGGELAAVALRCGFTDQSHFTNTLRRWMGITPGEYRANCWRPRLP